MPMSELDRRWIRYLRDPEVGVLSDEDLASLPAVATLVCCADGRQIDEVFDHHRDVVRTAGGQATIHTLTELGGALCASPQCPLFVEHDAPGYVLKKVRTLQELMGPHPLVLSVHAPCGAARLAGLNIIELIAHMVAAKRAFKTSVEALRVLCMLHVDYGDGSKRTYVVHREQWDPFYMRYLEGSISLPHHAFRTTGVMPVANVTT